MGRRGLRQPSIFGAFCQRPVRVRAVVRNRTSYQYGFEFVDLTPEHSKTINRTCRMLGLFL